MVAAAISAGSERDSWSHLKTRTLEPEGCGTPLESGIAR